MKRLSLMLAVILCIACFYGCNKTAENYDSFSSYMLDNQNEVSGDATADMLLASKALFAYKIEKTESNTSQTVYVWDNLLRRELRLDLKQIYEAVPDKDKGISISVANGILINKKPIAFAPTSELSFAVLKAIFPTESRVNAKTFRQVLSEMIIRLETVDYLGDTEVIAIQTIAENRLLLENEKVSAVGAITTVMHLSEITGTGVSASPSKFPEVPPTLSVSDGNTTIQAWRGSCSWMIEKEDGLGHGIEADSPHPLDCIDSIPAIEISQDTTLSLTFETSPTSLSVKRYKPNAKDYDAYEKVGGAHNMIEVKAGNYLYEVIAKWDNPNKAYMGTVYFAFKTTKP